MRLSLSASDTMFLGGNLEDTIRRRSCRYFIRKLAYAKGFVLPSLIAYNSAMRTTSYSELRKTLAATLDKVTNDHEPVIITRDRGKPSAVLISLEDFASYEETLHLLRSPKNADRLLKAIAELDAGKGRERKLIDPEK